MLRHSLTKGQNIRNLDPPKKPRMCKFLNKALVSLLVVMVSVTMKNV